MHRRSITLSGMAPKCSISYLRAPNGPSSLLRHNSRVSPLRQMSQFTSLKNELPSRSEAYRLESERCVAGSCDETRQSRRLTRSQPEKGLLTRQTLGQTDHTIADIGSRPLLSCFWLFSWRYREVRGSSGLRLPGQGARKAND
jgi:hypothetical protein